MKHTNLKDIESTDESPRKREDPNTISMETLIFWDQEYEDDLTKDSHKIQLGGNYPGNHEKIKCF